MSVPAWPETLPQYVFIEGYNQAFPDLLQRTNMEVGPAKVRRRSSCGAAPLNCITYLTDDQFETLDDFYNDTLSAGALRFAWLHPVYETAVEMRFTKVPAWVREGKDLKVTMILEILP
jgi:hypothetical protein